MSWRVGERALLPVPGTLMSRGREVRIRRNISSSLSSEALASCLLIIAAHPYAAQLTCQVSPKCFPNVNLLHPHLNNPVKGACGYYPCFTDVETEAHRGEVTCSRSHEQRWDSNLSRLAFASVPANAARPWGSFSML